MNTFRPEAYTDILLIFYDSPKSVKPISIIELHLFSYLSCILFLFSGEPMSDWGYSFSITKEGFPFSKELEEARREAERRGLIIVNEKGEQTPNGEHLKSEIECLLNISSVSSRRKFIQSATDCTLAIPVGGIRYAISKTPGVSSAVKLRQRHKLLDSPDDIDLIYDEYKTIVSVLGSDAKDLLSPAVIWLSARVMRQGEA